MLAMVLAGSPMTAKASDSTSWNFKNTGFKNLGTISSTVTVDNLSLIATSSKTMSVLQTVRQWMEQHIHMHWLWAAAVRQAIVQSKYRYREQTPLK